MGLSLFFFPFSFFVLFVLFFHLVSSPYHRQPVFLFLSLLCSSIFFSGRARNGPDRDEIYNTTYYIRRVESTAFSSSNKSATPKGEDSRPSSSVFDVRLIGAGRRPCPCGVAVLSTGHHHHQPKAQQTPPIK